MIISLDLEVEYKRIHRVYKLYAADMHGFATSENEDMLVMHAICTLHSKINTQLYDYIV